MTVNLLAITHDTRYIATQASAEEFDGHVDRQDIEVFKLANAFVGRNFREGIVRIFAQRSNGLMREFHVTLRGELQEVLGLKTRGEALEDLLGDFE